MTDVDQNNRQAQKWPELETKRLESAQASAKVDSKQRGLFDALSEVVKSGLKDLYGDVNDPKYLYIVNLVMARVRAAIDEKLVDFGTSETEKLVKSLDTKFAEYKSTAANDLSTEFTSIAQNAFSAIPANTSTNNVEQLDSIKEYIETAVKTIKETQSSDKITSKLDEVKDKLLKSFGSNKAETGKSKSDLKTSFRAKTQNLIQQQLTILASNQKRLQTNMSVNFKKTGVLVDRNVGKLDTTINSSMNTISGKLSSLGKSIKLLSLGSIMSSVGSGLMSLLSGPFGMITGALSKLWSGVCGLTKWAAGGLFSIIGKFFKSPVGLFAVGYIAGYVWTKWLKPWWDNIAKSEIGKFMTGEQGFKTTIANIIKGTFGINKEEKLLDGISRKIKELFKLDKDKPLASQIADMVLTQKLADFNGSFIGNIAAVMNTVGKALGIPPPKDPGTVTIGTALTTLGTVMAANFAASIAGSPILSVAAGAALAAAFGKWGVDSLLKKTRLDPDANVSVATGGEVAGAAVSGTVGALGRNMNRVVKTTDEVAKATENVKKATEAFDAAADAAKTAKAAGDTAKAADATADAGKALKQAIKAESSLEKAMESMGVAKNKVGKFLGWVATKYPKVFKFLNATLGKGARWLGKAGSLAALAASVYDLYQAYCEYEAGRDRLGNIKAGKAAVGILSMAGGPVGMVAGMGTQVILDEYAQMEEAIYQSAEATDSAIEMIEKTQKMKAAAAKAQIEKMSKRDVLQQQLENFDKIKAEFDKLEKQEDAANAIVQKEAESWFFPNLVKQDAARLEAIEAQRKKMSLLAKYGMDKDYTWGDIRANAEKVKANIERQLSELGHPEPPKLDFEMSQAAQKTIDDLRSQAQQTSDMSDDEFVEKIQEGFNNGNAQVIEMLKTIMMNQQNQKPSINTVMGVPQPYNPAMADTYGPAMHAGLNR